MNDVAAKPKKTKAQIVRPLEFSPISPEAFMTITHDTPASSTNGVSAGVVGTMVCPSRFTISSPPPSLPLFGSDRPPVAITTRRA